MPDQVLKILTGLPGAGKSTVAAAWRALDPQNRTVVNRDQVRYAWFGRYSGLTQAQEDVVTHAEVGLADRALSEGKSVTVDATNLKREHRDMWAVLAERHGVRHEVVAINTSLAECLRRNRARGAAGGRLVPEHVIVQMNATAEGKGSSENTEAADGFGTYRGMFDHHDNIAALDADWLARRANIPQWAENGGARGRLAAERANRADAIRHLR